MPIIDIPFTSAIAAVIASALIIAIAIISRKLGKKTLAVSISISVCALIAALSFTCLIAGLIVISDAEAKGAYEFGDMTLADVLKHNENAPVDQSNAVGENPKNCIVLFYRYSCPDCEETYVDSETWLRNQSEKSGLPVYRVSTRSENGKILKEKVNLRKVPSVGIFDANGKCVALKTIYVTENDRAVLDWDNLEELSEVINDVI